MEKALKKTLRNGKFNGVIPERSKAMGAVKDKGNKTTEVKFRFAFVGAGIQKLTEQEKRCIKPTEISLSWI